MRTGKLSIAATAAVLLSLLSLSIVYAGASSLFDFSSEADDFAKTTGRSVILITFGDISGSVALQNRVNHSSLITFELRNPGQTVPLRTYQVATSASGNYSLTDIMPGTYDVTAKGSNFLRAKQVDVTVLPGQQTPNINFNLFGGDADGDNDVDYKDRNILSKAWLSKPGSPNWDPRADFNNDGSVGAADLAILRSNYGKTGAQ